MIVIPLSCFGPGPSSKVRKAEGKAEKVEMRQKRAYDKARKKEMKKHYQMQSPETKQRMKESRKKANKFNKNIRRKTFWDRIFRKRNK
jgi:hypothetical protein